MEAIWRRVSELASQLRAALRALPSVTVHDLGQVQCGIVSFTVAGHDARAVREALRTQQINVSTSSLFSTRLDMTARGLNMLVRASVHYYNTDAEIERLCAALGEL
jgi:selenocysteine lyase/cysteine desulfurase